MLPGGTAAAAAAPAGRSGPLRPSGSARRADLGAAALAAESGSASVLPAEEIKELSEDVFSLGEIGTLHIWSGKTNKTSLLMQIPSLTTYCDEGLTLIDFDILRETRLF